MPKRVLVLSASVGAGHLRAAQAVELALKQVDPTAEVRNIDVLEFTNAAFRRVYGKAYLDLVNKAPHVLGYFYDLMDRPPSSQRNADRLRLALEKLNMTAFLRFLKSEPWDIVVNTHFLPAELIASLRKGEKLTTPHFTVTTDYETHRLWVNQPCDHYFSATGEGAAYLHHWGVPASDVTVSGIPIHPAFSEPKDRAACLLRFDLVGDRPIVLQLSGGFGVGPIEKIFRGILEVDVPIEVVVVTGRNEKVKAQLEQVTVPPAHRATILGFTDHMDDLMAVSDIVVSKPGGLTTSEVLASGAAMAVINPIPGQESRNSDYLLEKGAAVKINNVATLAYKLAPLLGIHRTSSGSKKTRARPGSRKQRLSLPSAALAWPSRSN